MCSGQEEFSDADRCQRDHCPQCEAHRPLRRMASTRARWEASHLTARSASAVPVPLLQADDITAARVCLAVSAVRNRGDRVLVGCAAAAWPHVKGSGRSRQVSGDALPAGTVLGAPFPTTGGEFIRRSGSAHCSTSGAGLHLQGSSDARVNRLDRLPSLSAQSGRGASPSFLTTQQSYFHYRGEQ